MDTLSELTEVVCPKCGERSEIFGSGGGERSAMQFAVPLLGRIPLETAIRKGGDEGQPVILAHPDSETAGAFKAVAGQVAAQMSLANLADES